MSHALTKRLQCTPTTPTNSPLVHRSQTMKWMVLFYVILWFNIYHAFKYLELRCNPYGNNNLLVRHSPYHPTANNPNAIHNAHTNAIHNAHNQLSCDPCENNNNLLGCSFPYISPTANNHTRKSTCLVPTNKHHITALYPLSNEDVPVYIVIVVNYIIHL
eukprot:541397_1